MRTVLERLPVILQNQLGDVVIPGRRKGSDSMLAGLRLGLALLVGLIGSQSGGYVPFSTGILLLVVFGVFVILFRLFRGPREPSGIVGWLTSRFGLGMILVTSVLLVAAVNPPRAVGIAAILAINVGLVSYLFLLRQRRG
jgi:hypothetical protein